MPLTLLIIPYYWRNCLVLIYLHAFALNLIVSFLTGRTQAVKINGVVSSPLFINTSIIQGSGVGPTFYVVMESDLRTLSISNVLCKYADDTNLLVSSLSDVDLVTEVDNVREWAYCKIK